MTALTDLQDNHWKETMEKANHVYMCMMEGMYEAKRRSDVASKQIASINDDIAALAIAVEAKDISKINELHCNCRDGINRYRDR